MPIVGYAVANNRMPFANIDCIASLHQVIANIAPSMTQQVCLGVLKLTLNDIGFYLVPGNALKNTKIIALNINLEEVDVINIVLFYGLCDRGDFDSSDLFVAISKF